ncbi:hypothetical protein ACH47Z_39125 [Streptomyces sp. NPDC020192]|uniref:hypothetical protein n=1 Tax=Streptomyces sp. NPDC020192 TaxID=3365066 RepID=UPI0037BE0C44
MGAFDPGTQQITVQGHDVLAQRQTQRGLRERAGGCGEQRDISAVFGAGRADELLHVLRGHTPVRRIPAFRLGSWTTGSLPWLA